MGEIGKEEFKRLVLEYLSQMVDGCATEEELKEGLYPILWIDLEPVLYDLRKEEKIKWDDQIRKIVLLDAGREIKN